MSILTMVDNVLKYEGKEKEDNSTKKNTDNEIAI